MAGGPATFWYDSRQREHKCRFGTHTNHMADARRLLGILPGLALCSLDVMLCGYSEAWSCGVVAGEAGQKQGRM